MRSLWSGTLSFGLVAVPVKLGSAVSSHKLGFRQIHTADHGRVRLQKVCALDEQVLTQAEIGRAYETADDQLIEISDDELKALPLPTAKTIEVSGFLDADSVDFLKLDTPYFLAPADATANKAYVLMREALQRSGKAAVGKLAMHNSEHLALVRAHDDVLILQTLRWPDEVKSTSEAAPTGKVNITDAELDLADTLINALGQADLEEYTDNYAEAVQALVSAKVEGGEAPSAADGTGGGGKVVDLMAALEASVAQARSARPDNATDATVTPIKKPAKKTAAKRAAPAQKSPPKSSDTKKSTAKKSTAKKTTAKKTTAKKTTTTKSAGGTATKATAKKTAAKPAKKTAAGKNTRSA
ncbi:Ku protein [Streptomyces sp. SID13666]|uniref:non-homologous end joining protein Ku n=1 Tax=unclassified Streptomyces TaxID=2593676 RepID=UPI0013C142CF|nr:MULTISPECIES: Ku protein [unclassified Streptomyces]NEA59916.1 Ku protein [Streptomyces sp. SID13666]NEA76110.1 Ku protein [Streptomyces sp. SID13588]